jgi:predicted nucleic acid-binding protein
VLERVTLDASVIVSAFNDAEASSEASRRLLDLLRGTHAAIIVPTLMRPEIVAAVRRSTGDRGLAKSLEESFSKLPGVVFQDLDDRLAEAAVDIVLQVGLKGADAVYAATARRFDAALVTLDSEQRTKVPADIVALYPAEAIAQM